MRSEHKRKNKVGKHTDGSRKKTRGSVGKNQNKWVIAGSGSCWGEKKGNSLWKFGAKNGTKLKKGQKGKKRENNCRGRRKIIGLQVA